MTQTTSIRNNAGFTLVEVMVAVLIMMVGMLGLLETINVTLQHNLKNELRNEATRLGEKYMTELRGQAFDDILVSYPLASVTSQVRGGTKVYTVDRGSQALSSSSKQVTVTVKWGFRNVSSQNRVVSVVVKP